MAAIAEARATIDGLGQGIVDWVTAGTNVNNNLTKARRNAGAARALALSLSDAVALSVARARRAGRSGP